MKSLCLSVAGALALLPCLATAPLRQDTPQRPEQEREEHETELGRRMEGIEDRLKLVRRSLREEGGHAAALAALVEIEDLALECKALVPEAAERLPEAERTTMVNAYRRHMVDFLLRQLELEAALLDGDAATIKQAFDRLREMEDPAHERFAPEEAAKHKEREKRGR